MTRFSLLLILVAAAAAAACQLSSTPAADGNPAQSAADSSAAPAETVEFEPAYPEDVSAHGLSEDDIEQQQQTHSHDGSDEHLHGDDSHGEQHSHDEGEPDDDHSH